MIKGKKILIYLVLTLSMLSKSYAQQTYNEAKAAYENYEWEKAIDLYTKSIQKKEKIAESYMCRGHSYTRLMKFDDAKKDLDMALKLSPDMTNLMYIFGTYYLLKGEPKPAIQYFDKAVLKDPKDSESFSLRGSAKAMLHDFENAVKDGDKSVEIDPAAELNYINRGYTKLSMQQYEEAIKDFDAGLKIKPSQRGYANRGLAYAALQMYTFAISSFNKSLEFQPNDHIILFYRGNCYEILEKYDEACSDYTKAKSLGAKENAEELEKAIQRIKC